MKTLLAATILFALLPLSNASAESDEGANNSCSCAAVFRSGEYRPMVRVECDSEYAGKCLQEVPKKNGDWRWKIVKDDVCAKYSSED